MSVTIATSTKFYDGKTSKAHTVSVMLSGSILYIRSEDGEDLATWSLQQLNIVSHPAPPLAGTICSDKALDARLTIEAGKNWDYLKSRIPKHKRRGLNLPVHWASFAAYGGVAVLSIVFLFMMFPRIIGNIAYVIPASWEEALGQEVMPSIVGTDKTCSAAQGQAALKRLVDRIETKMNREITYDVRVIKNSYITNAFAAPGGHIIIYQNIIDDADNPEELAGVLAHEMAHVELYHTTRAMVRDLGLGITLSLIFGDTGSIEGIARLLSQMSYSREDETEADMHAKKTLMALNINPSGLQGFLRRIAKSEIDLDFKGKEFLDYISSHPNTQARIEALEDTSNRKYPPAMSAQDWDAIQNICTKSKPSVFKKK